MTVTFAAIEEARRCIAGAVAVTPTIASPSLSRLTGAGDPAQAGEPPAHRLVQVARRPGQARRPHAGAARPRRRRHVGRQPRPGRGLPRPAPGHPGHDRHAGLHAADQGRGHAPVRGPGRSCTARGSRTPPPTPAGSSRRRGSPSSTPTTIPPSSPARARSGSSCSRRHPISTCWWCRSVAAA